MRHKIERNPLSMWWKQFVHASSQGHKVAGIAAERVEKSA
jgi:hypothetical protein